MKTLEELVKEKAKDFANDSWLSDTKDCLKETYNDHNPQSIQELVNRTGNKLYTLPSSTITLSVVYYEINIQIRTMILSLMNY